MPFDGTKMPTPAEIITTRENIDAAYAFFLEGPHRWAARTYFGQDAEGRAVSPRDPSAVACCAEGAIHRFASSIGAGHRCVTRFRALSGFSHLNNDDPATTYQDVLKAFRRAIIALRQEIDAQTEETGPLP
jgi:hypothetical protein